MSHATSAQLVKEYLQKNDVSISDMTIGLPPFSHYFVALSPVSGKAITFCESKLSYPFDESRAAARLINSKDKTYDFAKQLGINIPETIYVDSSNIDHDAIDKFLLRHDQVIVKPRVGCQSRGLTININNKQKLVEAVKIASDINAIAIVQEQIHGEELRFISLDGKVKYVMLRQKPFVVGDGISTVSDLIRKEDGERARIGGVLVTYPTLKSILPEQVLQDKSVPDLDERIELGTGSMIRTGASIYNIFEDTHQDYIDIANKIASFFGDGTLSVDIMIEDYTQPANDTNYALIELNTSISLPMCYSCRDGDQIELIEDYIGPKLIDSLSE
jgi:cyanophycin synthetase